MSCSVLGISAYYHDSAAVLLVDGEIISAVQEERFSREKHDFGFPRHAIGYILREYSLSLDDIGLVVFYDKPYLKFERLLETYHAFAPKGLKSFLASIPVWMNGKIFMRDLLKKELSAFGKVPKIIFSEHHLSHAASAFFPSPFESAAILTVDGVGEWATGIIGQGKGNKIKVLREMRFPHSLGLLYSSFTDYCGFKVNDGEYKLMGLAPYGDPNSPEVEKIIKILKDEMVEIKDDGSFILNMDYFNFATGLKMCKEGKWQKLLGIPKREPQDPLSEPYANLACAIQNITEEIILKMARTAKNLTRENNLVMAGGVALNCVANGKLLKAGIFDRIWIQPASGDAGGALGAACAAYHIFKNHGRAATDGKDRMKGAYLGPKFSDAEIRGLKIKHSAAGDHFDNFDELCQAAAKLLDEGNIIGWFQGRMEYGPRALGNRSILCDPRRADMQKRLNMKIKFRESFRPFAPSVLEEDAEDYFQLAIPSPYMLLTAQINENKKKEIPENYPTWKIRDKLYFEKSALPAITHVDFSARIQSVSKKQNARFWKLINCFKRLSGCGVLVNTSFNVKDEPIVCVPEDAYRCFMKTGMDYLIIGNYLFDKKRQKQT